jgi:hypothetical protein
MCEKCVKKLDTLARAKMDEIFESLGVTFPIICILEHGMTEAKGMTGCLVLSSVDTGHTQHILKETLLYITTDNARKPGDLLQ